jgi:hypothetical protein
VTDILEQIREGYRLQRAETGALRRDLASELYDIAGEASLPFYELLIIEAEHARALGDVLRAEALLRRAVLVADHIDHDPRDARAMLDSWYTARPQRMPAVVAEIDDNAIVAKVDLTCALMQYVPSSMDFEPWGPHTDTLYVLVSEQRRARARLLPDAITDVVTSIIAEANRRLCRQAPGDPNFIGIADFTAAEVSFIKVLRLPHEEIAGAPIYESSRLFVFGASGFFTRSHVDFVEYVAGRAFPDRQ